MNLIPKASVWERDGEKCFPLYNGALLNFPPERHNFWSGSEQFKKVQELTM